MPGSQTIERSLRSRSTIIRFSARYFGSVASACRIASSCSGVAPRGVVPLIGLVSSHRSRSTSANRSGLEDSRCVPWCRRNPAYGAGLDARSRRYAETGSTAEVTDSR